MRPIDAELLKRTMERLIWEEEAFYDGSPKSWAEEIKNFKDLIDGMPTIDAKPVVHSYWHHMASGYNGMEDPFMCDNCCYTMEAENIMKNHNALRYCSSCGARMDYVDTTVGKIKIREEDEVVE